MWYDTIFMTSPSHKPRLTSVLRITVHLELFLAALLSMLYDTVNPAHRIPQYPESVLITS